MRLLEKLKTLVEEEDKEYEPINKHKLDTRATAMRTSSGRSQTFKKRDGKTRKGQFMEAQQRKKHQQIKNKRERIIRGKENEEGNVFEEGDNYVLADPSAYLLFLLNNILLIFWVLVRVLYTREHVYMCSCTPSIS